MIEKPNIKSTNKHGNDTIVVGYKPSN